jgi:hypothetical protein
MSVRRIAPDASPVMNPHAIVVIRGIACTSGVIFRK